MMFRAFVFFISFLASAPAPAANQIVSAELIRASGEVSRLDPAARSIATDAQSFALIRYDDGTTIYLRPNTVVRPGSLFVEIGEIFVKAKGFFEVKTAFVTAGTQGTEYLTRVSPREGATVVVLDGSVKCESQKLSWPDFVLERGQKAFFEREGSVLPGPTRPGSRPPRIEMPFAERASEKELVGIRKWVSDVDRAAMPQ
jgi:hypothetical protein